MSALVGVRDKMEDVCSCIPDLSVYCSEGVSIPPHAMFAVYDGHSGQRVWNPKVL